MRIIISPAKKMNMDTDSFPYDSLPAFLAETVTLLCAMQSKSDEQLQALWNCNNALAKLNISRLRSMNLQKNLTPAILCYEGIQYQYMAPNVFESSQFAYISRHLRILSGFYGVLRPFDGVVPYRLEMQARLEADGKKNLYDFWGNKLANFLCSETDFILNLASKEYSKAVQAHLPANTRFLTCSFGELQAGKLIEKGTMCKMARGQMVRWLAENNITNPSDIKKFNCLQYEYSAEFSSENNFAFIKTKSNVH